MGSRWSYVVDHYSKANSWAQQNLGNSTTGGAVESLPLFTDVSGGEVNTAIIELSANKGHYIRPARAGESGFPTKIEHNDRIRITMADGVTVGGYDQVFEVVKKIPIKTKDGGTKLRIECQGIERHLQKVQYIKRFIFSTPKQALLDLVAYYQANKTTSMPSLTIGTNELPDTGVYNFDWGINEDTIYNRITELVDLMGDASGVGGVLDFFDFRFTYSGANVTDLVINVFSSGSPSSGSEVTIDANTVNTGDEAGGIDEAEGTLIAAWGSNDAGSLPIDYSRFKSKQMLLPTNSLSFYPQHQTGTYPANSIVQKTGITYTTATSTSAVPPNSPWTVLTTVLSYGGSSTSGSGIQYSPWTSGKVTLWKNSNANPLGTGSAFGPAMFDGNLVVNDDQTFRTWVDIETSGGAPSTDWTYDNSSSGYYDGFRVLVNGTGSGPFAGTDSNNNSYSFNIAEWSSVDQAFRVKYAPYGNNSLDSMQVAIFDSGKIKVWDNPTTGQWNEITSLDNGSDCFHPYDSIGQTTSVHIDPDTGNEYVGANNGSGVKTVYTWTPGTNWLENTFNARTSAAYYKSGAWLGVRWPFPRYDYGISGMNVGDIYGGGLQGTAVKEPSAIDTQNMHLTHNGYRGFNTASSDTLESEDYGQLSSIDFFMKIIFTETTLNTKILRGNFKMRAWLFDKSDHVVFQDFVIQFNDNYEAITLPLDGFQIYRGRRPRYNLSIIPLNDLIPPNGLAAAETFEWRHVVAFCVGTLQSYDDFGRYQGGLGDFGVTGGALVGNRKLELWMDGLRFTKPLLSVTDKITDASGDLVKTPEFYQMPEVFNYDQLDNILKSELQKLKFKKTEYDLTTEVKTDIPFGSFFFFTDDEIVDESDTADNKVKLVNKGTEYSITKPIDGKGGGLRRIRGARRFV